MNSSQYRCCSNNGDISKIKGVRCPIGVCFRQDKNFESHQIMVNEGTTIYMTTDGYADQIGGADNKKFYSSKLKKLIAEVASLSIDKQESILEKELELHMGNSPQTDDILLIGVKLMA
ncbi:MAG TPA: SpoIIE family protein phosphatase [Tenuifilaceae bacterium]|nr:SpoIIE family protein phosphatase [Tenuifilaceae bacterium]